MALLFVRESHHPHYSILQIALHHPPVTFCFWLAAGARQGHIDNPRLPDLLFIRRGEEITQTFAAVTLLLKELNNQCASARASVLRVVLWR